MRMRQRDVELTNSFVPGRSWGKIAISYQSIYIYEPTSLEV